MVDCGSCNACCTLLGVPDIAKPRLMTCWWTTVHGGCLRQADKASDPALMACAQFKCVWLESQELEEDSRWGRHLRPDFSGVMLGPQDPEDSSRLFVHVDPARPAAWKSGEIGERIQNIVSAGGKIKVYVGEWSEEIGGPVGTNQ